MASFGSPKFNGSLTAPGFGEYKIRVIRLGYGKSIVAKEAEARRFKAFYPQVATSGLWFVETVFTSHREMSDFGLWIVSYYNRLIDPYGSPLLPMTVRVPSRDFLKVGYPTPEVDFGDQFARALYPMTINFVSGSEPEVTIAGASKYVPPVRDTAVGAAMAPSGVQTPGVVLPPYVSGSRGLFKS